MIEVNSERDYGVSVRLAAFDVIERVLCNGIVAPWTAVPALVAILTGPVSHSSISDIVLDRETSSNVHERISVSLQHIFERFLEPCLREVYHGLQWSSKRISRMPFNAETMILDIAFGTASFERRVYAPFIQSHFRHSRSFLHGLLKPFSQAMDGNDVQCVFLKLSASILAGLKYRRGDEVCKVLTVLKETISKRSAAILSSMEDVLQHVLLFKPLF